MAFPLYMLSAVVAQRLLCNPSKERSGSLTASSRCYGRLSQGYNSHWPALGASR